MRTRHRLLAWDAASDNVGVSGYYVYREDILALLAVSSETPVGGRWLPTGR
ncbi:hypothetical protein [Streptomyces sp. SID9727]|uniref:hypothetical protein n=1 Tax=Streptomyces sp. SID9727 TaxID=2706114 RepID=UPI0013C94A3F|nr:hypothetical protein [Streptomyces sp. SID9727]NEC65975.1 hypothetical protein [Streptomyces sp. SID9727]